MRGNGWTLFIGTSEWVIIGGSIFWVCGGSWTLDIFFGEWGWVGVREGIFWEAGHGWRFFVGAWG